MSQPHAPPGVLLEVITGPHLGARFRFDRRETFLVGRDENANLQLLDDPFFSRRHFLLEIDPPCCLLRDLGSSNGTLVNDRKVAQCYLNHGDVISGGRTRIRFSLLGSPVADPAANPLPPGPATAVLRTGDATEAESLRTSAAPTKVALATLDVPGYEIIRWLGEGGMGVVYLARQLGTSQLCALKTILPQSSADEPALRRFLREINVLSRLAHPRIVRFFEMDLVQGQFFFAMEYVEAVDVQQALAPYPEATRVFALCSLVCHALEGLHYAHERGIVHRDVKPSNLLVARSGQKLRVKLADFGLAKHFQSAGLSAVTREGEVLGTAGFMSPEQVQNARNAPPASDIYAVAATLYYLLTRQYPYDFASGKDRLAVIVDDPPVPLASRDPNLPEGLTRVVDRCLAKDPAARFSTAEEMRQALLPFARKPPIVGASL